MEHFDLIIIGAGSGNSILSPDFDTWKVAIVESGEFGGTCLNRGCIPTKMFVHAADVAESIRHASALGIDARIDSIRWRDIRNRVFGRIDPIAVGGEDYRANRCPNVTVFKGRGHFTGPNRLAVGSMELSGDRIVVAAGARPMIPDIVGLDTIGYHTSDDIMRVDEVPERLVVIGGGFIANELAHVFGSLGSKVTIVHRGARLLSAEDIDIAERFTHVVAARHDVRLRTQVSRVHALDRGRAALTLTDGSHLEADAVLVATGRVPNTDTLAVATAGLATHPDGRLVVDEHLRTNVPGVWALGDICSPHMLKHVANHEARVVQHNLLHPEALLSVDHRFVPHAVFTRPQIAAVGLTEAQALEAGHEVMVASKPYSDTAFGWALEDTSGFCKLVADRSTRRLLGAHIVGPHSAILIQQLIQGMSFGQTVDEMARGQYYIHPALPEIVENALLAFE